MYPVEGAGSRKSKQSFFQIGLGGSYTRSETPSVKTQVLDTWTLREVAAPSSRGVNLWHCLSGWYSLRACWVWSFGVC